MRLWMSHEEETAREKVRSAAAKHQKNRWTEIKQLAEELEQRYDSLAVVRDEHIKARQALEEKELQNLEKKALGQPEADLSAERDVVKKAEDLLKAREGLVRVSEQRAKARYPNLFNFL